LCCGSALRSDEVRIETGEIIGVARQRRLEFLGVCDVIKQVRNPLDAKGSLTGGDDRLPLLDDWRRAKSA
jgi:hypothetical protein